MYLCVQKQLLRSDFQKRYTKYCKNPDKHLREHSNVISDQWTVICQERPPQSGLSWVSSMLKERFIVNLKSIRHLI